MKKATETIKELEVALHLEKDQTRKATNHVMALQQEAFEKYKNDENETDKEDYDRVRTQLLGYGFNMNDLKTMSEKNALRTYVSMLEREVKVLVQNAHDDKVLREKVSAINISLENQISYMELRQVNVTVNWE